MSVYAGAEPGELRMTRKPWFQKNPGGGWWIPATPQGYAIVVAFIVAVLACAWLPSDYAKLVLIGLGLAYMAASFWFSQAR
jgi:hypothetical protein